MHLFTTSVLTEAMDSGSWSLHLNFQSVGSFLKFLMFFSSNLDFLINKPKYSTIMEMNNSNKFFIKYSSSRLRVRSSCEKSLLDSNETWGPAMLTVHKPKRKSHSKSVWGWEMPSQASATVGRWYLRHQQLWGDAISHISNCGDGISDICNYEKCHLRHQHLWW